MGTRKLKREAQDLIDAFLEAADDGPTAGVTIGEFAETWTDRFPRSERTNATNDHRLGRCLPVPIEGTQLKDWPLTDLRRRHALMLADHMLRVEGRTVRGVANLLRTLSAMTEDAITSDLTEINAFKGVRLRSSDPRAKKASKEGRVWSWEEMHKFAAACGPAEPMVRVLSDCGLRIGEMFALRTELQDFDAGLLRVKGSAWRGQVVESSREKRHDRLVPIPPATLELIRSRHLPDVDTEWLFPTFGFRRTGKTGRDTPGGLLWRYENFRKQFWKPAKDATGMEPMPKDFRESYNSLLLAAGVDQADLAEILGHSEAVNRTHYTRALGRSADSIRNLVP